MSLPQIRADWAQHMVYGAWVGSAGAAFVLVLAQVAGRPGLGLLAPVASLLAALAAGVAKEVADHVANRRARPEWRSDLGQWLLQPYIGTSPDQTPDPGPSPLPHEVSAADVVATLTGAYPVAIPLFLSLWR